MSILRVEGIMAKSPSKKGLTYARSGVNIDLKSKCISALVDRLHDERKGRWKTVDLPGHFTGLIEFGEYALSLCTDGVGTKLLIAEELGIWNTVGIDCVAMNVNDTICVGAEPIAFVDYIAVDKPRPDVLAAVGEGLQKGIAQANAAIVGGEVAIMPDLVTGLDLSGTCLGAVKMDRIITGQECRPGDAIIGLPSSGVHSNGMTLARKAVEKSDLTYRSKVKPLRKSIGEELLTPTTIYVRQVLDLVRNFKVKGMVNVTGGGLRNFVRLKEGIGFCIDDPMEPNQIFKVIQNLGSINDKEMYRTFNMGLGFAMIVSKKDAKAVVARAGRGAKVIGKVDDSGAVSVPSLGIEYSKY
jgi:phosphoribosylformylglycinamidine cyclo-ligase